MSDYEYGNARLRAMRSRLLSRRELEILTESANLQGLIAALTKTVYQKPVEAALTRSNGMTCIDEALHTDLVNTIGKISGFYHEETRRTVDLVLRIYDIGNLKTILRGLSKNVPSGEIIAALLPVGELKLGTLRELARSKSPREVIDRMASQSLPFAAPLLKLRGEHPGADTFELELALVRWHVDELHKALRSMEEGTLLASVFALDADLANLQTVLRFVNDPHEYETLHNKTGSDDISPLFLRSGKIPIGILSTAGIQDTLPSAIETLAGTKFEAVLRTGLEIYSHSHRLSDIEKQLKHYRLQECALLISKDPLGIGVVFGYIALKMSEVGNIRWIAYGINLGLKADVIQRELDLIS